MNYNIIETFTSIDGEGPTAGEIATFIRFAGCDLRCAWCDTKYSWDGSVTPQVMNAEEIYDFVHSSGVVNVTLTGGEPLIQKGIGELLMLLVTNSALIVRIETHGGVDIGPFKEQFARFGDRIQFIVDFKLPGSGMMHKMHGPNLQLVAAHDTYKFVITSRDDLQTALDVIKEGHLTERCHVYFSPVVDLIEPKIIVEEMVAKKLTGIKLQLQLHKYIWPKEMRGV